MFTRSFLCLAFAISGLSLAESNGQETKAFPFVFPNDIAADSDSATNFSFLNDSPAGTDGFIRIENGHFVNDKGRFRVWGLNFCFGANFPEHEDAKRIARKLASLGVNCARFHHHETMLSPNGLFKANGEMDPTQVDKLDFFLAELHKCGIYANINLHVGRSVSKSLGLPPLGRGHSATGDKHAMHFMPQLQTEFWKYCRDYMGHVNPYRGMSRGSDPAIAMVEILNENRFSRDGTKYLRDAPEIYKKAILGQWNGWLKTKYETDESLRKAWATQDLSSVNPMADSKNITKASTGDIGGGWKISDNGGKSPMTVTLEAGTLRIEPEKVAGQGWQQQIACEGLSFKQGEKYTFQFDIRADAEKSISFNSATLTGGWKQLGLGGSAVATPQWKTITEVFEATGSTNGDGRVAFDVGGTDVAFELRNMLIQGGAGWKEVPEEQGIATANIGIPGTDWVPAAYNDFIEFMTDTERSFYAKTTELLRGELGVKVPICGTQTNYVGAKLASEIGDYTDMHSYWNHPLFLGREWDQSNWTVGNEPIAAGPYSNSWPRNSPLMRAAWRVHGMPFTYSEWNTGEPSFASAGGIPIMALMGALQDWDGIFFFDYEDQGGRWDDDKLDGFFRINGQPCKLALLGAFGKMYRAGDLQALTEVHTSAEGGHYADGVHAFTKLVGLDAKLDRVTGTSPPNATELAKTHPPKFVSPNGTATWDATDEKKATISINTDQTKAAWGLIGNQDIALGEWRLSFGDLPRNYGALVMTSLDGKSLSTTGKAIIAVVNHAENENMDWNEDRTSVGKNWGDGPSKTWGVPVKITVVRSRDKLSVFAVDGAGKRLKAVPVSNATKGYFEFELDPKYKTLLYEFSWSD